MEKIINEWYMESVMDSFNTHVENRAWDKVNDLFLNLHDGFKHLEIELELTMSPEDLKEYAGYKKKSECQHNYDESFY